MYVFPLAPTWLTPLALRPEGKKGGAGFRAVLSQAWMCFMLILLAEIYCTVLVTTLKCVAATFQHSQKIDFGTDVRSFEKLSSTISPT